MRGIGSKKGDLLKDLCSWILEDLAFVDWWNGQGFRFLWIHGNPGKGKTMMTIALISSIRERLAAGAPGVLSFFFCQNTVPESNRATSVLKGLIYLLISQHGNLICHLQKPYIETGIRLFEGQNELSSLWEILLEILKDESLSTVYLIVDALDECDKDMLLLLKWITHKDAQLGSRVKWLVTSRNEPQMKERLEGDDLLHTSIESNSSHVSKAVSTFIDIKVAELTRLKKYNSDLQFYLKKHLRDKAEGTFLWVALVCKELEKVIPARTRMTLQEFPEDLEGLYEQMMKRVESEGKDTNPCKKLLCTVTLASRPLSLKELAVLASLPPPFQDEESVENLVDRCGSFIIVEKDIVYFVHQSAKDYFSTGKGSRIFQEGQSKEHARIADLCLQIMRADLKRDICDCLPDRVRVSYACVYWISHFKQADHYDDKLQDNGPVHQFLKKNFLHWLEAVSSIKKLSDGILAFMDLRLILSVS